MKRRLLPIALCLGLTLSVGGIVHAEVEPVAATAKRVTVSPYTSRSVLIGSTEVRLAPGARIFSDVRRTIVPGRIPPQSPACVLVETAGNSVGDIRTIWLLSAEDAALKRCTNLISR